MYSVVGSDGQVYGPVDMATLSRWIAEGRIVPTTELIDPIDGRRIQAQQAPALMGSFPTAPQTPPGYPQNPYGGPQAYGYPRPDMMAYAGPPKSKVAAALSPSSSAVSASTGSISGTRPLPSRSLS